MIGIEGWDEMSKEEQELLLDLGQFALDIIGIIEPTPFADASNAVISIARRDWWGTLISGVSIVPYVGDLAKLGKISKYTTSLQKAITLARKSGGAFAAAVKAMTQRIQVAIRRLPVDKLPRSVRDALDQVQRTIGDFGSGGLRLSRLDKLTDETLIHVFGSTRNVGVLPRKNVRTIVEFFDKHKVGDGPASWSELIKGIDLHAVKAVEVIPVKSGEVFAQYVETARPANRRVGQWMVRARAAVSHRNIGLSGAGRERKLYRLKSGVEMLQSKAAGAADHWTTAGSKPHKAMKRMDDGSKARVAAEHVAGGGDQYFLPKAWDFLEEVK